MNGLCGNKYCLISCLCIYVTFLFYLSGYRFIANITDMRMHDKRINKIILSYFDNSTVNVDLGNGNVFPSIHTAIVTQNGILHKE